MKEYRNLIFDLGGVIINLDESLTVNAFAGLSSMEPARLWELIEKDPVIHDYEKGLISDSGFKEHVEETTGTRMSDEEFVHAWNAMLLDIVPGKLEKIESLRNKYRMFIISNTNNIHIQEAENILLKTCGIAKFDHWFRKAYYSHEVHMRKPDTEIFIHVMKKNKLHPAETLFLDDSLVNVEGARRSGMDAIQIKRNSYWPEELQL